MSEISRDSFKETQNILNDLRGLAPSPQSSPKHYVSIRLQQGVPLLDADWNEQEDIRRIELETILVNAIGSGVPAGNNGFQILEAGVDNDFIIETGLLLFDGWLAYNGKRVNYTNQPHRNTPGVSPPLPTLQGATLVHRELVYLDAWELEVGGLKDTHLIDQHIGVETCTRLERAWIVRMEPIAGNADPLNPATIPNRQSGHRYYPLATVDRLVGNQISQGMITDLRRTHLTLESLTHAPLFIDDPVRGQRLDSPRLAGAFRGNLDVMRDLLVRSPQIFVYAGHESETWQAMTAFQDVRASATSFEQQALNQLLHRQAASGAMNSFYQVQEKLMDTLQQFVTSGIAGIPTQNFVSIYRPHLDGTAPSDPTSLKFALSAGDLLGAILAQERLNEELGQQSDTLPEGNVTANLVGVAPPGAVIANTSYQLTIRIQSNLTSAQGSELIRAIVSAGVGWTITFQGSNQPDPREIVITVPNGQNLDIVLFIFPATGASNTTLNLTVRPERRQQLVYNNPPVTLAIGQEILPNIVIATLNYQPPPVLQPGNVSNVARSIMAQPGGVNRSFSITNLSTQQQQYQLTVTPQGTATGWQAPNQPILGTMDPNEIRNITISFGITDQVNAVSPLTYRMQLVRVTGGANEPLANAIFNLTFNLT